MLVVACLAGASCKPEIDDRTFLVDAPRILAIAAEPAEGKPGDAVTLTALYVDANGTRSDGPLDWALCRDRKPLTDPGVISPSCLVPLPDSTSSASPLVSLGAGLTVMGTLFDDGCRLFGPDPPPPAPGQPQGRPVDPDYTGGYYLPMRVRDASPQGGDYTASRVRIACELAGARQDQFIDFNRHYRSNANPTIASFTMGKDGPDIDEDQGPAGPGFAVHPGATISLHVEWPVCPTAPACGDGICGIDEDADSCADDCTTPKGCGGSEAYLWFDGSALSHRREAIRVSWFATAGTFQDVHTGRDEASADDPASDNTWFAPSTTGDVVLWVVLRDDRGGEGWKSYRLRVEP